MSTYKMTGPDGCDYAVPSPRPKRPLPPPPPKPPVPPIPPCPPIPDWEVYPFYPPYPDMDAEPVPTPPIPGRRPPVPPPHPFPPIPPHPPVPPYPPPKPEKVDECSKKLAKLTQKTKVLVQMIKDFEDKNRPVILTIGPNSYSFGTENITDFNGDPAKGMYANIVCGDPIEDFQSSEIEIDDTNTRVYVKNPVDLLQTELARVRKEITLVAAAINGEISGENEANQLDANVIGVDDNH